MAGDPARRSGIVLAACPIAKSYGISTADRLGEAVGKCPDVIIVQPQMQHYIDVSIQITNILKTFSDLVEPYSIDELFMDCTHSIHLFASSPEEMARIIQNKIKVETGVFARAGISENKILAKICCDLIAKKNKSGIFNLHKDEVQKYIWHFPVEEMWGVGSRMKQHLNRMGIHTIGDLANTPLPRLTKRWGVNGQVLWQCANGVDDSPVTPNTHGSQKIIGNGMTLPRDYYELWEIQVVIQELVIQVCRRLRQKKLMGRVVSVSCSGADFDFPQGFSRQIKMDDPTDISSDIYQVAKSLFIKHWTGYPIRRIGVAVSELSSSEIRQLTIFDYNNYDKKSKAERAIDLIKDKYGESSILTASSITSAGQAMDRAMKIGGHYK